MTKRKRRLLTILLVQVIALFALIFHGIRRPVEIAGACILIGGSAVTTSLYFTEPRKSSDGSSQPRT